MPYTVGTSRLTKIGGFTATPAEVGEQTSSRTQVRGAALSVEGTVASLGIMESERSVKCATAAVVLDESPAKNARVSESSVGSLKAQFLCLLDSRRVESFAISRWATPQMFGPARLVICW